MTLKFIMGNCGTKTRGSRLARQMTHLSLDVSRYFVDAQLDIPIRQLVGHTDLALQQVLLPRSNDLDISNM